jgi:hypothetical protein
VAIMRLPVFIALTVAFFASPATVPLIVLACVVGYVFTFAGPELEADAPADEQPNGGAEPAADSPSPT